jgi:ATP-dependent DNA helicase DinG
MQDHPRAWIFTSATLAVGEDFSHFKRELGIEEAERAAGRAFHFERQSLLYCPGGLPDPTTRLHPAVVEAALPVLRRAAGVPVSPRRARGARTSC